MIKLKLKEDLQYYDVNEIDVGVSYDITIQLLFSLCKEMIT